MAYSQVDVPLRITAAARGKFSVLESSCRDSSSSCYFSTTLPLSSPVTDNNDSKQTSELLYKQVKSTFHLPIDHRSRPINSTRNRTCRPRRLAGTGGTGRAANRRAQAESGDRAAAGAPLSARIRTGTTSGRVSMSVSMSVSTSIRSLERAVIPCRARGGGVTDHHTRLAACALRKGPPRLGRRTRSPLLDRSNLRAPFPRTFRRLYALHTLTRDMVHTPGKAGAMSPQSWLCQ